jgi:hypothetical protein
MKGLDILEVEADSEKNQKTEALGEDNESKTPAVPTTEVKHITLAVLESMEHARILLMEKTIGFDEEDYTIWEIPKKI